MCILGPSAHGHLQYGKPNLWYSAAQSMTCRRLNIKNPWTAEL